MREVLMESQAYAGDKWTPVGSVSEVEPPGSVSSDGPGARRMLVFGWFEGSPGVWESEGGWDVETEAFRAISSIGMARLSDLSKPYYIELYRRGLRVSLRFTLKVAR